MFVKTAEIRYHYTIGISIWDEKKIKILIAVLAITSLIVMITSSTVTSHTAIKDTKTVPMRLNSRLNKHQNTNRSMDHTIEMSAINTCRLDTIITPN